MVMHFGLMVETNHRHEQHNRISAISQWRFKQQKIKLKDICMVMV